MQMREADEKMLSSILARVAALENENKNLRDEAKDRKSTRLNSSHTVISYAVFCLKKKNRMFMERQTCDNGASVRRRMNRARLRGHFDGAVGQHSAMLQSHLIQACSVDASETRRI